MARLRYNSLSTTLGASLTSSATAVTFAAALTHAGGSVPTITGTDYIPLSILDSAGKAEIVYLTAYTLGATTGTITRAREGSTAVSHASGDSVVHGGTANDALGLAIGAKIYQTADQSLASGVASISFGSVAFNYGADVSTTSQIKVTQAGLYLVIGAMWWSGGTDNARSMLVNKNGTGFGELATRSVGGQVRINGAIATSCVAGDIITAQSYSEAATTGKAGEANSSLAIVFCGA